jgi:hypothetical protein
VLNVLVDCQLSVNFAPVTPVLPPEKGPSNHYTGSRFGFRGCCGQVWKISTPPWVRAPDRRTHSELLDRLSYPSVLIWMGCRHVQKYSRYVVLRPVFETRTYEIEMLVPIVNCASQISGSDMIYLLTAIGLIPVGSSTVHIYTERIHRTAQ